MPDEMARKIEEGDIFVFDHEIDSLRDMVESPSKTARYHEVQRGLVLVDFNCCEQKVGQPVYGYIARWREDMDRLLYLAADSTMPYDEVMCMVEAYRARVKAETHPWAKGFLAFGMDEVSQEVKRRVSKRCGRDFIPVDFLVRKLESGEWNELDWKYQEYDHMKPEIRRRHLLRLHKRVLAVDFMKIESRLGSEEREQALLESYQRLEKLSSDIFSTYTHDGDFSKEIWSVWFDYIEKMEAENDRRKRERLKGCEEAIRQIESLRAQCYVSNCVSEIEKDVDEWLHEKFLRIVGRPMANGK